MALLADPLDPRLKPLCVEAEKGRKGLKKDLMDAVHAQTMFCGSQISCDAQSIEGAAGDAADQ
jgi:hypothetical protein